MISNSSFKNTLLFLVCLLALSVNFNTYAKNTSNTHDNNNTISVGAERLSAYFELVKGKNVGVLTNQTGVIKNADGSYTSTVDFLLENKVNVKKIYAPEHGFRGTADAGELVKDGKDMKTGLPIISLYGNNKKPSADQLKNIDIMLFDLQDVGARFYTYISSLHYLIF